MNRTTMALAAGLLLSSQTAAQTVPTPGTVGDTLRPTPQLAPPAASPAPLVTPAPAARPGGSGRTVAVAQFEFDGNERFDDATLAKLLSPYTGRALTLFEVYDAADVIANHYIRNGYTLAAVNVPPQKISEGVIRFEVLEGRIGKVAVEGKGLYETAQVQRYLQGLEPGSIYQGARLEQGLAQLNELPGLQARAVLAPGAALGESDLLIQATERPVQGALLVDNFGRENIGRVRYSALFNVNNPLKHEDQLTLLLLESEEELLKYRYLAYSLPVNLRGSRLELSYGDADFKVQDFAGVGGYNRSGRIGLSHPLLRERSRRLGLSGGVSSTRSNSDLFGLTLSGTQLTLLDLTATYQQSYANFAATQVISTLSSNFDRSDRAELADPDVSDDQRFRAELDIQHLHPLKPRGLAALLRVNGVYSPDPLADTQQFSLGGPNSVRGYPASEVRGDRGYFGSLTLRQPFSIGQTLLTTRVFADAGRVFRVDLPSGSREDSLSSIGLGADVQWDRLNAKLDWSFPQDQHPASDGRNDSRLYGSLTVSF
ncbi:MAG TPA: ShlB/FhaC/HecB family hemolysin secretion/activation protein [Nevskiaceae bacterium]|nr:ShlB/FhaC/HecB family hemolysin secretion/activation protein [Nevskiaceae bacterium]